MRRFYLVWLSPAVVLAGVGLASAPGLAWAQAADRAGAYYQFLLARHLAAEGQAERAVEALQRAAELDPGASTIRSELGMLYLRLGRPREAIAAGEAAVALDADSFDAHRVIGLASAAMAESGSREARAHLDRGITHLERAAVLGGIEGRAEVERTLARLYLRRGDPDRAVAVLEQLLVREPDDIDARPLLAQAYSAAGRFREAAGILEELVAEAPQFYPLLGDQYARQGQWAQAADAYRRATAVYQKSPELKRRLAWALRQGGDAAGGLTILENALQAHPDDPLTYVALAEAYSDAKQLAQAVAVLERAERRFPRNTSISFQRGAVLEQLARYAEAEQEFRAVLDIDPKHAPALNYLGYMLAERGERLDESVDLIKRALEIDPDNGAYLDSLGWAYFKQDKLDLAEPPLRRAAEQLQSDSVIQDHYGDLLFRLGRRMEAIQAWERALKGDRQSIDPAEIERKIQRARQ